MHENGLGQRIRQAMGNESARSIARKAGISDSTLRSILAGARPTVDNLVALALALGVGLDWLATGAPDTAAAPGVCVPVYAALAVDAPPTDMLHLPQTMVRNRLGCQDDAIAAIVIADDAMAPTLSAGDLALIDRRWNRIVSDDLYVMTFGGTTLLRRVQRRGAALMVIADNPAFPAWTIEAAQTAEARVKGRVVGAIRRI